MKTKVYNLEGKEVAEMDLNEKIFGIKVKPEFVHEVFVLQMRNQRQPWADTKNRGEVSGGGKKPWRQKGTGRARHGSIRSPIWVGGGVAFGPLTDRNYKAKINKRARQLAAKMCLADKAAAGFLYVVEDFAFAEPKTKIFEKFLGKLPAKQKRFLVLTGAEDNAKVYRMTRNLKRIETSRAGDASVISLVRNEAIIASKEAINDLEKILTKSA